MNTSFQSTFFFFDSCVNIQKYISYISIFVVLNVCYYVLFGMFKSFF